MNIKDLEREKNEGIASLPSEERRNFLKIGLAVTGVFLGGSVLSLTSAKSVRGGDNDSVIPVEGEYPYTKHYGMVVRQNNCVGCEKCVEACRETNHVPVGHGAWRTIIQERLTTIDGVEKENFVQFFATTAIVLHVFEFVPPGQLIKIQKLELWSWIIKNA